MKISPRILFVAFTLSLLTPILKADVTPSPIICSHMVLQRDVMCPIWGTADAGEEVTVEFAGQKLTTKAGEDGKWMVRLALMKATNTGATMTIKGKNTLMLGDVVVGEVWLCSGQSNMEFTVGASNNAKEEIAAANNPLIRHFKVPHVTADKPQDEVQTLGGWQPATPATVGSFTGAGYFFAREIYKKLDMPVGLIGANWGGTRIEPWTPPSGFQMVPALKSIADNLANLPQKTPLMAPETEPALDKDGKPVLDKAGKPTTKPVLGPNGKPKMQPALDKDGKPLMQANHQSPLAIYNAMIHPLINYQIRGVLWYQGESNNGDGMLYLEKMKALIGGWRKIWNTPLLPFYFVELAPYGYPNPEFLPRMWEAQAAATKEIPNTGMSGTSDIGNVKNIHPTNKQEVGRRLALLALSNTYGKPVGETTGPIKLDVKFDGAKAVVRFTHAAGLKTRDGQSPTDFMLAGEDKKFVPAKAEISGQTVIVTAEGITNPVALRFSFLGTAEHNLVNSAGLPARPFRTDDWPVGAK